MTTDFNCGIYQIRNITNGKRYVGQSINLKRRKATHRYNLKKDIGEANIHLQRSYNKYGKDFFVFETLIYCEPFELTRYEQFFVDKYKKTDLLYNIGTECVDTCKGIKRSLETIIKMSEAKKGKKREPFTDKHKKNIGESLKGQNNPMYGIHLCGKDSPMWGKPAWNKGDKGVYSPESIKKMSEAHKGKVCSLTTRRKLSESRGINRYLILQILKMLDKGISKKEIVKELKVTYGTIRKIKNGWYDDIYDLPKKK